MNLTSYKPNGLQTLLFPMLAMALSACNIELPSAPPELHHKFTVIPVGQSPNQLITVDLNEDGHVDIVSANSYGNTLTLLYGKGNGDFAPILSLPVLAEPTSVAAADLNDDGILDLITNARGADALSIILGNSDGTFKKVRRQNTGRVPLAVIPGDFNQDRRLDIAVPLTFGKMEIHLGLGGGLLKKGSTYSTGSRAFSGVTQDFDNDGFPDIALAASSAQASSIRIFPGLGDGGFAPARRILSGKKPLVLILKDMNGDQLPDLVCASGQGDNLYMLFSNGDGSFQDAITFSGGGGPMALVAGHFNDDTRMDVAVANSRSSSFSMAMRRPDGGFQFPTRDYVVDGGTPLAITSGDYNGDGREDIAVASNAKNTVEIYLQRRLPR